MIKILSLYYKNFNYGGQLQAWALCQILGRREEGCIQISFEDLKTKSYRNVWQRLSSLTLEKVRSKLKLLLNQDFRRNIAKRKAKFREFENDIPHSKIYNESTISQCVEPNDIFVVGSDQVWNPDWTSDVYFLNFVPVSNLKIAYAASFGKSEIPPSFLTLIYDYLNKFDFISVREKDAKIVLENYLKKKIALVLDPTLLMNEKEWGEIADFPLVKRPYIFVYLLGNNLNQKKMIKQYAKWKNLEIVYIPHVHLNYQFSDNGFADTELYDVGPKEFLGLIQNATEVITDSFHGCVFSIIFKKQFCAFKRHRDDLSINMNTRLYTLLDSLHLRNRLIDDDFSVKDIQKVMLTLIDYEKVGEILVELRKQSLDYLMSAISGDKR